jgi:hypothetical protein
VVAAWLHALGGGWPIVATTIGWLLYRCYRLRVLERMHDRKLASAEAKHALEVRLAWGAAQLGAATTLEREGITVMPSVPPTEAILDPAPETRTTSAELGPPL